MSNLRVIATIPAKRGSEDIIREALTQLVATSQNDDGCIGYELFESAAAPGTFVTVESWRDQAALDLHMQAEHVAAAFAAAGEHLGGDVAIHPLMPVG